MGFSPEFREKLALKLIPSPLQPGLPQPLRQVLQQLHISWVFLQQRPVVIDQSRDKQIIRRILSSSEIPVHKKPFDPLMPWSPWVAGQIHSLGVIVCASNAGRQGRKLILRKVRGFIQKNRVIFLPLVLQDVSWIGAVSKFQPTAVCKHQAFFPFPIIRRSIGQPAQRKDVVFPQFGITAPQQQNPNSWITQGQKQRFLPHSPAFSSSSSAAVSSKARSRSQKFPLSWRGLFQMQLQQYSSLFNSRKTSYFAGSLD